VKPSRCPQHTTNERYELDDISLMRYNFVSVVNSYGIFVGACRLHLQGLSSTLWTSVLFPIKSRHVAEGLCSLHCSEDVKCRTVHHLIESMAYVL